MSARLSGFVLAAVLALLATAAGAQSPREPAQSQACVRLESQLAALDRGMTDPARADLVKRYEDAVSKQQFELDRMVAQARRSGCEGSGFFLFGGGSQSPQCVELNGQVQRLRAKLDRMMADLQRLQGSGSDRAEQRRGILSALADNDCGPQYRSAAPARPRGFFDALFGSASSAVNPSGAEATGNPELPQSSTYRTLCVRTCDGYYFPISFATVPSKFQDDERTCQRLCPAAEVNLFTHRNPGEDVSQSVSTTGKPYTSLPNAFHYRQEFSANCSCRRPGQSWAEALGSADDTIERGDIVVTDEKAKAMAAPKLEPAKSGRGDPRKPKAESSAASPEPAPSPRQAASLPDGSGKRTIRSVGPQFLPSDNPPH